MPNFKFLHESDTYPHSKFFCSANKMKTMMNIGYSYGFDGSMFWAVPFFGCPDDETVYSKMFAKEHHHFTQISFTAQKCKIKGVEISYDPFYYTIGNITGGDWNPLWTRVLGNFGIPYSTDESDVAFWDKTMATYADEETVKKYLSKGLFLDAGAASILCKRGYGKYLGVEMGDVVSTDMCEFDQCSYEIIKDGFVEGIGNTMANARSWCPKGNGVLISIIPADEKCEVVTEVYNIANEFMAVAMTRFINCLGGRIVIMGTTLENNNSQCLFNYPRQMLMQNLIKWCCDEYAFVRNGANVFCIMNECVTSEFVGMLTLVNLCSDDLEKAQIYLPKKWREAKEYLYLDSEGEWSSLACAKTPDGIVFNGNIDANGTVCIMAK